jgi:hypothetical protein
MVNDLRVCAPLAVPKLPRDVVDQGKRAGYLANGVSGSFRR